MQPSNRCLARSDFPGDGGAPMMAGMHATRMTARRSADLLLRSRGGPVTVRIPWPGSPVLGSPPPVVLVLADPSGTSATIEADEALCEALCSGLGALVLFASWDGRRVDGSRLALERAAGVLEWAADHAGDVDGGPERVVVAGRDAAAAAATVLAVRARDRGWPPLLAQVLLISQPSVSDCGAIPVSAALDAPAPATIVAPVGGSPCARRLREAGARVTELVDPRVDLRLHPDQPFLPALTDSLCRSLSTSRARSRP
jgi:alpha/beta hydrolase fold